MKTYTFHVSLPGAGRVWRKIEIGSRQTLEELHYAIQKAYGWDSDHLYSFFMSGTAWDASTEYRLPEGSDPWGMPIYDEEEEEIEDSTPEGVSSGDEEKGDELTLQGFEKALIELFGGGEETAVEDLPAEVAAFMERTSQEAASSGPRNVLTTTLEELGLEQGQTFMYLSDYGDEWRFKVRVHAIIDDAPEGDYPRIVESVGKAPEQYPSRD